MHGMLSFFIISVGVWFLPDPPENLVKLKPGDGEVLQKPGETIFMLGRWWHVVLNLDFPVAVTHKITALLVIYQSHGNAKIFRSRPKLAAINTAKICDQVNFDESSGIPSSSASSNSSSSSSSSSESDCEFCNKSSTIEDDNLFQCRLNNISIKSITNIIFMRLFPRAKAPGHAQHTKRKHTNTTHSRKLKDDAFWKSEKKL
ncbi:histone arginine demethylase JMJD6 [Trichinella spiralis]|uniref:histone arginine demethylase JMJD6 n=1 Tax=Trichinella spiralis TaxID=6334 RepID=UPI0001EFC92C|nr:histone arginine demethylase JMJD6 [Trichinella spiralis]